ncbi:hypothetical protein Rsub_05417 [Raphidocelis subcapitata]|uniref:Uncharacterized protein n=1 Tax=Raphidocelis subcapitata TaxID=307507 RepID=A0A2V0NYT1_9CHLO|nr:hypothetical protein Rsub_05417 [Raphidocelis subcapitata]|eukprot:GBF92798.1 hypothetical protein Rsub_05417 [Raphidocelis subcapitata]
MGAGGSKHRVSAEEEARIMRKCNARRSAMLLCRAANPENPQQACERLEAALAMCFAGEVPALKAASAQHERCFTSLMNTGGYQRRRHCDPELGELKAGLTRAGLFPFKA